MWMKIALFTYLIVAIVSPAYGQADVCIVSDSLKSCFEKLVKEPGKILDKKSAEQAAQLQKSVTSTDAGSGVAADTTTSLDSLLNIAYLFGFDDSQTVGDSLVVNLSGLLPKGWLKYGVKIQGVLDTEPDIYEPFTMKLTEHLGEEGAADLQTKLQGTLQNTDDITWKVTVNRESGGFGRRFRVHKKFHQALVGALPSSAPQSSEKVGIALGIFLGDLQTVLGLREDLEYDENSTFIDLAEDPTQADALREKFENVAVNEDLMRTGLRHDLKKTGLNLFSALVNNQKQLNFTASFRDRTELAGPDEFSVKLQWEHPFRAPSISGFKNSLSPSELDTCLVKDEVGCDTIRQKWLSQYTEYIAENRERLKGGDRFALSLEYVDIDDLSIDRPDDNIAFSQEGSSKLIASVKYGRNLEIDENGVPQAHLDFSFSWEDISDDPMRQDRGVARLTYTRKVRGVEMPFGLVYVTRPEFLGMEDVDEQLSAHVGVVLKWKDLFGKESK